MFRSIYNKRTVLVTGHTGFKGSWLSMWLCSLGAKVIGYALSPPTVPNHFSLINLDIISIIEDIRNKDTLQSVVKKYKPEMVFHLAAQSLVRHSYKEPIYTLETNIMGTANLLESCRNSEDVRVIVNVTSDKCYENKEVADGYRETDQLGGYDIYSASKACCELITNSYKKSFFDIQNECNIFVATARAGNVIGGGDWAEDRLIPDIVKSIQEKKVLKVRNPNAVRPWQHALEPLAGYLMLGQKLFEGKREFATSWNFGPDNESNVSVEEILKQVKSNWDIVNYEISPDVDNYHEAELLRLNSSKARLWLKWRPVWDLTKTISITIRWYKEFYENNVILSLDNLNEYIKDAKSKNLEWTK